MSDSKGPITLVTDLSHKRNRWKGLAFSWRSVAISALPQCTTCGSPALWSDAAGEHHWCEAHYRELDEHHKPATRRLPWYAAFQRAIDLEKQIEGDS